MWVETSSQQPHTFDQIRTSDSMRHGGITEGALDLKDSTVGHVESQWSGIEQLQAAAILCIIKAI